MTAAANATVSLTRCQYCEHGNPGDSKYCNNCGATLTLAPCPHCGAVNEVTALACYQCRGALPASLTTELVPTAPVVIDVPAPSSRRPARALVFSTAAVAAIAAIGYFATLPKPQVDAPPPAAARSEASNRGSVDAGTVGRDTPSVDPIPAAKVEARVEPAAGALTPPPVETPPVAAVRGANPRRAGRQPVESSDGGTRSQPVDAAKAAEQRPARAAPCTDAVAALGLCTPKPGARPQAAEVAAKAASARPQPAGAAKGDEREPPRQEPCTDAVAALGLCTLKPIPRRE